MNLEKRDVEGILVVMVLEPRLDAASAKEFKRFISEWLDEGYNRLVLNLKPVDFIDSTGMTAVVSILKKLGMAKGEMKVCEVGKSVSNILKLTKLDRVFEVTSSEEEAISALNAG